MDDDIKSIAVFKAEKEAEKEAVDLDSCMDGFFDTFFALAGSMPCYDMVYFLANVRAVIIHFENDTLESRHISGMRMSYSTIREKMGVDFGDSGG